MLQYQEQPCANEWRSYSEAWRGREIGEDPCLLWGEAAAQAQAAPTPAPAQASPAPAAASQAAPSPGSAAVSEQATASTDEGNMPPQQAEGHGARLPRVFYATRTHSQIAQVRFVALLSPSLQHTLKFLYLVWQSVRHRWSGSSSARATNRTWPSWYVHFRT